MTHEGAVLDPKGPSEGGGVVGRERGAGGAPTGLEMYTGLLGESRREGYWLLYPTLDVATTIEIRDADVAYSELLPPAESPFGGLGGTRLYVRRGAQVVASGAAPPPERPGTPVE